MDKLRFRLIYLIGQLGLGGAQRQLYYLLKAMDRERYKPAVVVWRLTKDAVFTSCLQNLGVPLYTLPDGIPIAGKMLTLRKLCKQLQPEVVHSYSFFTNIAVDWPLRGLPVTTVGSIRCDFWDDCDRAGQIVGRLSARWPSHQICNSLAAKNSAVRLRKFFKPTFPYVVRNALDLDDFEVNPVLPEIPTMLALGRLAPQKRWDLLLDAIAVLKKRGLCFTLLHAGDGPMYQQLISRTKELGLEETVQFLGYRRDISTLMSNASFLLHTSDHEGSPNVVMEAMASGRAVVATDAGDTAHLIDNEITGYVVPKGDLASLVECSESLLKDRTLCQRMGQNGRIKAEKEFAAIRLVDETLAAYRQAGWRDLS